MTPKERFDNTLYMIWMLLWGILFGAYLHYFILRHILI